MLKGEIRTCFMVGCFFVCFTFPDFGRFARSDACCSLALNMGADILESSNLSGFFLTAKRVFDFTRHFNLLDFIHKNVPKKIVQGKTY